MSSIYGDIIISCFVVSQWICSTLLWQWPIQLHNPRNWIDINQLLCLYGIKHIRQWSTYYLHDDNVPKISFIFYVSNCYLNKFLVNCCFIIQHPTIKELSALNITLFRLCQNSTSTFWRGGRSFSGIYFKFFIEWEHMKWVYNFVCSNVFLSWKLILRRTTR